MSFSDLTLEDFCLELASDKATPGGGSVAALGTALSSALLNMVIELTEDNTGLDSFKADLQKDIKDSFYLMDKDSDSFDLVMQAFKLPKETKEEKAKRKEMIQEGLKEASLTPLDTMKLAYKLLEISIKVAREGNENAVTDAGTAGYLAFTALKSAYFNVLINTSSIDDKKFVTKTEKEAELIIEDCKDLLDELNFIVVNAISS